MSLFYLKWRYSKKLQKHSLNSWNSKVYLQIFACRCLDAAVYRMFSQSFAYLWRSLPFSLSRRTTETLPFKIFKTKFCFKQDAGHVKLKTMMLQHKIFMSYQNALIYVLKHNERSFKAKMENSHR